MSVQNQTVKNVYVGNGSTTVFPYTFELLESDGEHVKVYIADEAELSVETTNFTIDTTAKTITYPRTGEPLPSGHKIVIRRELPNEQDLQFENNGAFFADDVEGGFDKVVMLIQQLQEAVERAVKTDMSSVTTPDELIAELRTKAANAVASAQAAAQSAAAAATSETNAGVSEANASTSATAAATSASEAATSAGAAGASASNALSSETNASASATSASNSASAAAGSATAAAASESTAGNSATAASASATAASTSETNAAASATAAATSATSAANSAEQASTFAHRLPVGTIYAYAGNGENPIGALLCDGSAVSRTMYPELFEKIGTTYGAGDGSTTFNLPNLSDNRFAEGSTTAGTAKSAGLPNITGSFTGNNFGQAGSKNQPIQQNYSASGALKPNATVSNFDGAASSSASGAWILEINASQSNSIYSDSVTTVQPKSLTLRYFIQAFDGQTPDSALIDITQYAQELATKANRQLSNLDTANLACHVVVDSYYDSTTGDWYRVYDDGWVEQGGYYYKETMANAIRKDVTFLKPFSDTKYSCQVTAVDGPTNYPTGLIYSGASNRTTTTCKVGVDSGSSGADYRVHGFTWVACGKGVIA